MTPEVKLAMLGRFAVSLDGHAIDEQRWKLRKAKQLVKILALAPGQRLEKERLLDLLWPELDPAAADNSFRQTVFVARRALDPVDGSRLFQRVDDAVELWTHGTLWTDVEEFRERARRARTTRAIADHEAALATYAGDLLPEDAYEDWGTATREELRALRVALMLDLAELYHAASRADDAIGILEQVIALQSTNEAAHLALMRIHSFSGQRRRALRQYEVLSEALKRELDAAPEIGTRQVYEQILAEHPTPASGLLRPQRRRHNLPAQLTTFIGRSDQLVRIAELLGRTRLVTLAGPPGTGKTRLALTLAERMLDSYRHGVWAVDVGALTSVNDLAEAIGSAIGEQTGGRLESLTQRLRDRQMLIVLDACEQIAAPLGALVTDLLRGSPSLTILATSRETLHAEGEAVVDVPPLALPGPGEAVDPDHAMRFDAVRLFAERAALARPGLVLSPKDLPQVLEICRRLDGLPLAIELAAAQLRALSVQQVASRLDRAASSPYLRLRSAIEQSLRQASEEDRRLFRRLGAFRRSFTFEAVEAVAAGGTDVGDALWRLVDKSLVRAVASDDGTVRYSMLDTIRDFAASLLESAGELGDVRQRHADHYAAFAIEAARTGSEDQIAWFERLEAEHDELRAAQDHFAVTRDGAKAIALAAALGSFFDIRGYLREGRMRLDTALALSAEPSLERVRVLQAAAQLAEVTADHPAGRAYLDEALVILRARGDHAGTARTLHGLIWILLQDRRDEQVLLLNAEQREHAEAAGDQFAIAQSLTDAGNIHRHLGQQGRARELYQEALAILTDIGHRVGISRCLFMLGSIEHLSSNNVSARAYLEKALGAMRELGDVTAGYVLGSLAFIDAEEGAHGAARDKLREAQRILTDADEQLGLLLIVEDVAYTSFLNGLVEEPVRLAGAAAARRAATGVRRPPDRDQNQTRWTHGAREHLGAAFDALWAEGERHGFEWAKSEAARRLG